jgi:phosphoribosyl-ATP pyrophosphohydrolase
MSDLMERIEKWHIDKFGVEGPPGQPAWQKVMEEMGELKYERFKGSKKKVCNEATDVIITMVGYIHAISPSDVTVSTIIESKLEEVEERNGEIIDGQFVKESDLDD